MTRRDLLLAGLLVFFLLLALGIRDAVGDLGQMGTELGQAGVALSASGRDTAGEIRDAFGSAADAAGALPVVGGDLGDSLRRTGEDTAGAIERQAVTTGQDLAVSGRQGEHDAHRLADLLGLLAFLLPALVLGALWWQGRGRPGLV
ncbi:MAG: hypothetical protein ACJ762_06000 [Solirubrobacteraceae bacterium]